jgi:hypothetical protein
VRHSVTVIVATGGHLSALAAKAATSSIPIIFNAGEDPVTLGLVTSINRPGGNATGVYVFLVEMDAKRMELLRELVPNAELIAVLLNPAQTRFKTVSKEIAEAARAAGQRTDIIEASNEREIHGAFRRIQRTRRRTKIKSPPPVGLSFSSAGVSEDSTSRSANKTLVGNCWLAQHEREMAEAGHGCEHGIQRSKQGRRESSARQRRYGRPVKLSGLPQPLEI